MMIASVDSSVLSRQWIGKFKFIVQLALSLYETLSPAHYTDGIKLNNINIIDTKFNITKRH